MCGLAAMEQSKPACLLRSKNELRLLGLFRVLAGVVFVLVCRKFLRGDFTITIGVNTCKAGCITGMFHLTPGSSHLTHFLRVPFIELGFDDLAIAIQVKIGKFRQTVSYTHLTLPTITE